jgi:hypothetical protein
MSKIKESDKEDDGFFYFNPEEDVETSSQEIEVVTEKFRETFNKQMK